MKWRITAKKYVQYYSCSPNISSFTLIASKDKLGTHIAYGATKSFALKNTFHFIIKEKTQL
jgi:hypothetical protein